MNLNAALFEILLPLDALRLLRLEFLNGFADLYFPLIAFDFLFLYLAIMLLNLAKTVLDCANKMLAFRHYDCRSLAHAPPSLIKSAPAACFAVGNRPRLRSSRSNASKPARPRERTKPRHSRPLYT